MTETPSRRPRGRRAPLPRFSRPVLIAGAVVLFGGGLYLGIQVAKPPPPPDFSQIEEVPPPAVSVPEEDVDVAAEETPLEPPPLEVVRQPPSDRHGRPRIALVIDDLGRSLADLDTLRRLDIPISYAVLPFESHTPQVVAELRRRGAEILCHLPMQAKGNANPGPGALYLDMDREEIMTATRHALAQIPGAVGVNNHMGSGISSEHGAISAVLDVVAEKNLFYLDSRTSSDTLGYSVARQIGVPAAERQVFLDTENDRAFIAGQFAQLLEVARQRGAAIAIGHPYPATLEVLATEVAAARQQGFEFVVASSLLDGS